VNGSPDLDTISEAISLLEFGKKLPTAIYVYDQNGEALPFVLRTVCNELRRRLGLGEEFNILKFHLNLPKISFLEYPEFSSDPHPSLAASVLVDLATGRTRRDNYSGRVNPPILHRKETFLPPDHADIDCFSKLTKEEEAAGLLNETSRIGFRLNWDKLVAERGYGFRGHRLVLAKTSSPIPAIKAVETKIPAAKAVERHKTAIFRTELSKPLKLLLELNLLRRDDALFDYGCGHGTDVASLARLGYRATGWDPVHAPDHSLQNAEVVNLGFVLNVIEDPAERVEVLQKAWELSDKLLVVTTLIRGQEAYEDFRCFGDGILTSRNTFQKFFEPAEFLALLEDTLGCEASPVKCPNRG